jgi:hypothetical protein
VNDELEMTWSEAVVAYFKVLFQHLPGGTEENNEKVNQDKWSLGQYLNPGCREYKAGVLPTQPRGLICDFR